MPIRVHGPGQVHAAALANRRGAGRPLSVRVGVSAGDVLWEDDDCFGDAVNEAARLCAAAGLPAAAPLADFAEEEIDRARDVNLRAGIMLARLLAAKMIERERGHLVFISS